MVSRWIMYVKFVCFSCLHSHSNCLRWVALFDFFCFHILCEFGMGHFVLKQAGFENAKPSMEIKFHESTRLFCQFPTSFHE